MDKVWTLILAIDPASAAFGAAVLAAIWTAARAVLGYFGQGYGNERGKNLARQHDLDKLEREMATLTRTAEQIKSAISGDLWTKQAVWTMKRDGYYSLVVAATELENALVEDYGLRQVTPAPQKRDEYQETLRSAGRDIASAWKKLNAAVGIGRLVLDDEAVAAIDKSVPKVGSGADAINSVIALRRTLREQSDRELSGRRKSN